MTSGRHHVPGLRLYHGQDSLDALHGELERLGCRRAVILCGASLAREGDALALVRTAMGDRFAGLVAGVKAHSPLDAVVRAAGELAQLQADGVVAVGGGSAVVTARAASIVLAEGDDVRRLCTTHDATGALRSPRLMAPKLPQLVVPTTPTTATLKAGSAVLDPADGKRLALFDPKTRAQAVFVHDALVRTPPRELVISASLNTLTMAVEGLMSHAGDPFSDAMLLHSVRLLAQRLPQAAHSDDPGVRNDLMFASLMCGHGTDYTSAGIALPLGHALSACCHIDGGIANALVLPHVIRFNAEAAAAGLEKLAGVFGSHARGADAAAAVTDTLETLFAALGLPRRLRDAGVPRERLKELAAIAMEDWFVRDNPRVVRDARALEELLEAAW